MTVYYDGSGRAHEPSKDDFISWRPSAYGIAVNEKGQWLVVRPSWTDRFDLPGGGVGVLESLKDGLKREFYEETGYRVEAVGSPIYVSESMFHHPEIGFCHAVIFIYFAKILNDQRDAHVVNSFENKNEITDVVWVDPLSLKESDVQPIFWPVVQQFANRNS